MKYAVFIAGLLILSLSACSKKPAEMPTESPAAGNPATMTMSKVDIASPADGARLDAKAPNKLDYNITLDGDGNHAHVYVDNNRVAMLREMKGSYPLEYLEQGKREICIRVVNRNHTPMGAERCITVMVE